MVYVCGVIWYFFTSVDSCTYHLNLQSRYRIIASIAKNLMLLLISPFLTPNLFIFLSFWEFSMNRMIWYVTFWDWLLLLVVETVSCYEVPLFVSCVQFLRSWFISSKLCRVVCIAVYPLVHSWFMPFLFHCPSC